MSSIDPVSVAYTTGSIVSETRYMDTTGDAINSGCAERHRVWKERQVNDMLHRLLCDLNLQR